MKLIADLIIWCVLYKNFPANTTQYNDLVRCLTNSVILAELVRSNYLVTKYAGRVTWTKGQGEASTEDRASISGCEGEGVWASFEHGGMCEWYHILFLMQF